jgi:hypothetical protein
MTSKEGSSSFFEKKEPKKLLSIWRFGNPHTRHCELRAAPSPARLRSNPLLYLLLQLRPKYPLWPQTAEPRPEPTPNGQKFFWFFFFKKRTACLTATSYLLSPTQ